MRVLTIPVEPAQDLGRFLDAFVRGDVHDGVRDVVRCGCSVERGRRLCVSVSVSPCRDGLVAHG
jgi:hypothetical protein